jgi:UPF0716 family protein affecting phage T7 exclusion
MNEIKNSALSEGSGRCGLNGNQLRLIAVISMIIDHIGALLWEHGIGNWLNTLHTSLEIYQIWFLVNRILRTIGRIAFPVFAFLLVIGYLHTRDWKKYALRLAAVAVISELPFDWVRTGRLCISWTVQNTVFTLLLGLLMLKALDMVQAVMIRRQSEGGWTHPYVIQSVQLIVIAAVCLVSLGLRLDYDYEGILLIALLYWFLPDLRKACLIGGIWMTLCSGSLFGMAGYAAAFFLICHYNGEQGRWKVPKLLTYGFYPLHLVVLWILYLGLRGCLAQLPV